MVEVSTGAVRAVQPRAPLREVGRFVVLAFGGAWLVGGVGMFVLGLGQLGLGIGVLMVAVAALACARRDDGSVLPLLRQVLRWKVRAGWYAAALGLPFAALAAALVFAPVFGAPTGRSDAAGLSLLLLLPVYVLFFGGPEELGWRGYVLPRLQTRFNALASTLILSAIWMGWHAPLFFLSDVPGFSEIPLVPYLIVGVASSFVYTWLYNSTGGSILLAMLLHAAKNLSLAWVVFSVDFALYAAAWVAFAVVLLAIHRPPNLARIPRQQVGSAS